MELGSAVGDSERKRLADGVWCPGAEDRKRMRSIAGVDENGGFGLREEQILDGEVASTERHQGEEEGKIVGISRAQNEAKGGKSLSDDEAENDSTDRLRPQKKRKVAMFVAYSGVGYQGMQRNPGAITIEGELEEALCRAGAIAKWNFGNPKKVDWMRAARTDKGVSAAGQVISGKFVIEPPGLVERINSHLPRQIRVLGYKRVTQNFSSKNCCDRRRYEYVLPVFAFDPPAHVQHDVSASSACTVALSETEKACREQVTATKMRQVVVPGNLVNGTEEGQATVVSSANTVQEAGDVPTDCSMGRSEGSFFQFDEMIRQRFNSVLRKYVGTHNFHNFTSRVKGQDPSATRYILSFEAGEPFDIDGLQFVRCVVVGQSFMLHQIRKMIGLAVAVMRGFAPASVIDLALRPDVDFLVPTAPEVGLFLDECVYSGYNNRYCETHEEISLKDFEKEIDDFKREFIYPQIAKSEAQDGVVASWLLSLNDRNYSNFVAVREQIEKCTD